MLVEFGTIAEGDSCDNGKTVTEIRDGLGNIEILNVVA
jgi:hypothetical protein